MPSPTDDETPFPSLSRSSTLNAFGRSHLSPDDAFVSPPRRTFNLDGAVESVVRGRRLDGERSRSRRRKRVWKKLMWVKQSCMSSIPVSSVHSCKGRRLTGVMFRSGQLYRSSNFSRKSSAKSATQTLRLLAPRRRLDRYPPTCLLRHHFHRIICRNFSRARLPRLRRELEQRRDVFGMDPLGAMAHGD